MTWKSVFSSSFKTSYPETQTLNSVTSDPQPQTFYRKTWGLGNKSVFYNKASEVGFTKQRINETKIYSTQIKTNIYY